MAASPTGPVNIANTFLDVPTLSPSLQGNVRFDYRFNLNSGLAARIFANAAVSLEGGYQFQPMRLRVLAWAWLEPIRQPTSTTSAQQ